jgi:hypothetical protein
MRHWLMFALACGSLTCAGTAVRPEPDAVLVAASGSEALYVGKQSSPKQVRRRRTRRPRQRPARSR